MFTSVSRAVAVASLVVIVGACGGGSTSAPAGSTSAPAASAAAATPVPAASQAAPTSAAASGGMSANDIAGACTDLKSLKTMDYAFGEKVSNLRNLDASGRARTLDDITFFASTAPADLQAAANDLVLVWTDLVRDPTLVADDDARYAGATATLEAWMTANCQ